MAPPSTMRRRSIDMSKIEDTPGEENFTTEGKTERTKMPRRSTLEMMQADPSLNDTILQLETTSTATVNERSSRRGYASIVFFSLLGVSCLFALGLFFVDTSPYTSMHNDDVTSKDHDRELEPCTSGALKVSILTDNYPVETTWTLKNGCSGEEVMSGGVYNSRNTLHVDEICTPDGLLSDTYYEFTINDSYGDGVCCGNGSGSYTVEFDGDEQIAGGEFGSVETKKFGNLNCGPTTAATTSPIVTPNSYSYKPVVHFTAVSSTSGYVIFTVDASNDAHIAIGEDMNHNGTHYEIVLGGWGNTRSQIRGANQNPTLDEYIGNVLQSGEDRKFRISLSVSEIKVEQEVGSNWSEIMTYSDRDTSSYNHDINYMMIATGWGASGLWNIVDSSEGASEMRFTPNHYSYIPFVENFADVSEGHVTFAVQANNDAHIALGPDTNYGGGTHYEIVLGGWGNTRSKIRASNERQTIAEHPGVVLDSNEYVLFRVSWDDRMLKVERSPNHNESSLVEIMKYDRSGGSRYKYDIDHVMISTGWGSTGLWKVICIHN